ncbi:hypothetical protein SSIL_3324 [Solibacillus silvestris StLB046]|uniref:SLH domain-containing protein n=1 Tax=Solibacillus silvestris (strain StLB046) TaxID=1002809 RepID=F2F3U9_SOLSS|nr:S-layer homology domain-containing protein [Solibacillus silvestris]BAK17747.1 hypothetical protein SSIL_3324 [Solibacillus silvestris StLB046]
MANQPKKYTKFVAAAATATLVASAIVPVASAAGFSDVADTNSHAVNINALAEAGIIGGYQDGTFKPNQELTRGQVVKMLGKWVEKQGFEIPADYATKARFTDLAADAKDQELVKYAALVFDTGVFAGSNGALNAGGKITRENMALVLDRAFKAINDTTLVEVAAEIEDIKVADLNTAKAEAREAIQALRNLGISGVENFMPKNSVTRGQFASFLNKTIQTEVAPVELTVKEAVAVDTNTVSVTLSDDTKHTVKLEKALEANKATEIKFTIDEKEYTAEVTYVLEVKSAVAVDATTLEVVLSDDTKHTVKLEKALEANKATEVTFSINGVEFKATVTHVVHDLTVSSVKAINANELLVTFSKEVLEASVEVPGNFEVLVNNGAALSLDEGSVTLQDDKKSVIITLPTPLVNKDVYKVNVAKSSILAADYSEVLKFAGENQTFSDVAAPVLVSAKYNGSAVEFTFNKPLDLEANTIVKIDGKSYVLTNASSAGKYVYTATVALTAGEYNYVITGATDTAGNEAGTLTGKVTVSTDKTAPKFVGVKAINSNTFEVSYDEAISATDLGTYTVKKGSQLLTVDVAAKATDAKVVVVTVTSTDENNALYGKNETSIDLSFEVTGYKDNAALVGDKVTGKVTLTTDTKAPAMLAKNLNTLNAENTSYTVVFDEALDSTVDKSKLTLKKSGIIQPSVITDSTAVDNKDLDVVFGSALASGSYTLEFAEGAVKDANGNKNKAFTVEFTVGTAAEYLTTTSVTEGTNNNTFVIDFDAEMTDAATNTSNYKLDGLELPAGSKLEFYGDKTQVLLTLPTSFAVKADAPYTLTIGKTVTTKSGSIVAADVNGKVFTTSIDLVDNVAPELATAKFVTTSGSDLTTQIELTFTEALNELAEDAIKDDLIVTVGGNEYAVTASTVVTDGGKVVTITVPTLNINQATTVSIVPEGEDNTSLAIIDDSEGANKVKVTSISVTK